MTEIEQPAAQRLLRECRDLLEHDLGEWMDELGPALDEALFGLANTSHDDAKRSEYLRLRNEVQASWSKLSDAFKERLAKDLQHVKVVENHAHHDARPAGLQLELVDDKELTERIVAREFVARVAEFCSEEMYALDRRVALLVGKDEMSTRGNRFGPKMVCEAVRAGCEAMLADIDSRTLLLRQMERQLQAELPALYRAINEILIEAGILPELKRTYRRSATNGTSITTEATGVENILNTLQRLAQARIPSVAGTAMGHMSPGVGIGVGGTGGSGMPLGLPGGQLLPPGAIAVSAEFFKSLQALQTLPAATPGVLTNVVRMARESDAARQAPPLDAITMDIVATLFDLIFDDDKVAEAVKGMISRLQIPVLKVAMIDPQFFADRSHPARRFLDSISGIAIRWGSVVKEGDPFYVKLSGLVEHVQNTFDQDVAVFGTALTELATFVTEHEVKEAETSRVVVEAMQRKESEAQLLVERQQAAGLATDAALTPLLETKLPLPIEQFLRGQWRAVLQKIATGSGPQSVQFQTAVRISEELVWSVTPMKQAEDRQRLAALLPKLLPALHQGLDHLGISTDAHQPLFDALMLLHSAALRADKRALRKAPGLEEPPSQETAPRTAFAAETLHVTHLIENGIQIEEVSLVEHEVPEGVSVQSSAWMRRVKHLVRGDWVEFIDNGQARRERLTWLSPRRTVYIFSNHATNCAISITPEALAHRLQNETARLVEHEAPMFERALDGAIKVLEKAA